MVRLYLNYFFKLLSDSYAGILGMASFFRDSLRAAITTFSKFKIYLLFCHICSLLIHQLFHLSLQLFTASCLLMAYIMYVIES